MKDKYSHEVSNIGVSIHSWLYMKQPTEKAICKFLFSLSRSDLQLLLDLLSGLRDDAIRDKRVDDHVSAYILWWHTVVSEVMFSKYSRKGVIVETLC